jgi:hypothetical protein
VQLMPPPVTTPLPELPFPAVIASVKLRGGRGATVKTASANALPDLAVTVAVPGPTAVTVADAPDPATPTTFWSLVDQVTL